MTLEVPLAVKVEEWKAKALAGTITAEEMRDAVTAIRAGRFAAAQSAARTSRAKEKAVPNIDSLLNELDNL